MSFQDLLNKPLPSRKNGKSGYIKESIDDVMDDLDGATDLDDADMNMDNTDIDGGMGAECGGNCNEDADDDVDDMDDIDISDLSDEELDQLEADLEDSDLDDAVGDVGEVDLSPEEEKDADDFMGLAATTALLKDELNVEERAAFYSSPKETSAAVYEGFLLESDIDAENPILSEDLLTEAKVYNKTTVRFSKDARKAQLYAIAVTASARAHNDPDYFRYQKICKMKRAMRHKLERKYHGEALRRMKVYFNRLMHSKSGVLSNLAKKIHKEDKGEK